CKYAPITLLSLGDALGLDGVISKGLDKDDLKVLYTSSIDLRFGHIGMNNMASTVGMDERTVSAQIDPFLLRAGFLKISRRGRKATELAFEHLGLEVPFTVDDSIMHNDDSWEEDKF